MAAQAEDIAAPRANSTQPQNEIQKDAVVNIDERSEKHIDDDQVSENAQAGVRAVQAATKIWSKWHLIAAYFLVWLTHSVIALQQVIVSALTPYVTSSFRLHSLTATTGVVSSIVGGLIQIPLAKILDTWGRPQGLVVMLTIWVLGFIMMAACNSVELYSAAQVFSSVGSTGISYTVTVFVSDTSSLKSRALMLAFATTPYIFFTWAGGPISQSVLNGPGWRWGFGVFAIVLPVVVLPLATLIEWNQRRAIKAGILKIEPVRLTWASVKRYCIEVDAAGCLILAAGMALFLLPFSIYSYQGDGWASPLIICMIVFGGLLLVGFVLYEKFLAPVTFIPFHLLMDRTVFSTGIMFIFVYFNSAVWGSFFGSMLQAVWGLNVRDASYISAISRVSQCLFAVLIGFLIRWSGRFKWIALSLGIPLMMIAVGLKVEFRTQASHIGLVAMTQVFSGLSSGAVVLTGEMAMMTPSDHQHIAVIIAVLNLFCSIGSAAGGTVAGAIWTSVFPEKLREYLPSDVDAAEVYGSLAVQISYPLGSPARKAIQRSYAESQRLMLITSLGLLGGALICVLFWRNLRVNDRKQTRGMVA